LNIVLKEVEKASLPAAILTTPPGRPLPENTWSAVRYLNHMNHISLCLALTGLIVEPLSSTILSDLGDFDSPLGDEDELAFTSLPLRSRYSVKV